MGHQLSPRPWQPMSATMPLSSINTLPMRKLAETDEGYGGAGRSYFASMTPRHSPTKRKRARRSGTQLDFLPTGGGRITNVVMVTQSANLSTVPRVPLAISPPSLPRGTMLFRSAFP
jgi:hypothetical protein